MDQIARFVDVRTARPSIWCRRSSRRRRGATDEVPVAGLLGRGDDERPDGARHVREGRGRGGGAVSVGRRPAGEENLAHRRPAGATPPRPDGPGARRKANRDGRPVRRDQGGGRRVRPPRMRQPRAGDRDRGQPPARGDRGDRGAATLGELTRRAPECPRPPTAARARSGRSPPTLGGDTREPGARLRSTTLPTAPPRFPPMATETRPRLKITYATLRADNEQL